MLNLKLNLLDPLPFVCYFPFGLVLRTIIELFSFQAITEGSLDDLLNQTLQYVFSFVNKLLRFQRDEVVSEKDALLVLAFK